MRQHDAGDFAVVATGGQARLGGLDVPIGQLVPHEATRRLGVLVQSEPVVALLIRPPRPRRARSAERVVAFADCHVEARENPLVGARQRRVTDARERGDGAFADARQEEATDVPQLGRKVAPGLERLVEVGVIEPVVDAQAHLAHDRPAQRVGAVARNDVERIDPVAERLRHLAALRIAHRAVQVHGVERRAVLRIEVDPRHDHARDPEEEDLGGGHEHVGRIEGAQVVRVMRPAERRERPEPTGGPGVEDVLVLPHRAGARGASGRVLAQRVGPTAGIAVEHRNAVSPPELARDVPVADRLHPVDVDAFPSFREDAHAAVLHRLEGRCRERRHLHEPLVRESRLDDGVAAIAATHRIAMLLRLHEVAGGIERRDELLTRGEPVEALECGRHASGRIGDLAHRAGLVDHHRHREPVAPANVEVVGVVRWRDLECTGAEGAVDVRVGDHGNLDADDRERHLAADEVGVALVVGVHGNGDVGEHRLGARGRDHEGAPWLADHRIRYLPQLTVGLVELRLLVGERRETARAPVDDPVAAVDEAIGIEADERLAHGARALGVEGVGGARPVGTRADGAQLLQDHAAGLGHERLHPFDEGLAAQVETGLALLRDQLLDHVLRGDAGVVGAGHPEGVVAGHAAPPHDHVLDGVVEPVPDVEHRGHVRGRHHDREWGAARRASARRREHARRFPAGVEGALRGCRVVRRRQLGRGGRRARHERGKIADGERHRGSAQWRGIT